MKNFIKLLGIVALVAVIGLSTMSCAMLGTVGGTADPQGFLNGNGSVAAITDDATPIASYNVILGLISSGYDDYVAAVRAAEAEGKKVSSVTQWKLVLLTTTAYAR